MKFVLIPLALLSFSTSAFAVTTCPAKTKPAFDCKNAPQKGDSEVLSQIIDTIKVCNRADNTAVWVVQKGAESDVAEARINTDRIGAIIYEYNEDHTTTSLSIPLVNPKIKTLKATLSLDMNVTDLKPISTTFSCRRK